ncbi:hsp90 co-chaperone Cdc37-like [Cimex lectularius]|uniref:Hsp90 co-chaperone Cdc37 n=1 Tax=Cimex lectularius TaxID=79782 RepID=A0A8I6RV76_CIMLE|nr:hsp90 co-chaperone Cdc37-like [Cimex lectularius]
MVDYSKWKSIEISDDEDETHPNIDTPSLFRWKHQARIQRMEEAKKEKEEFAKAKEVNRKRIDEIKEQLSKGDGEEVDVPLLTAKLEELERTEEKLKKTEEELRAKERVTPWNVDTISQPGFTKTLINKPPQLELEELSEEEREKKMQEFIEQNEKELKVYGMLRKYEDSKKFLQEHLHLVSEYTSNYLVIWCINLELEGKQMLSQHVAHQCICMQYILELGKQLEVDPRACVSSFFTKIQICGEDYKSSFDDELKAFINRVRRRAEEKLEMAIQEQEIEEREARLGPGGLDPLEVFESLPESFKECFEKQDIPLLQKAVAEMPEEEAAYHMKRCVDSGLWLPDGGKTSKEPSQVQEESETKDEPESSTSQEK